MRGAAGSYFSHTVPSASGLPALGSPFVMKFDHSVFICASTISQQTAKNVFLWNGGGWVRKGFEAYFTVLSEWMWTKPRIMEIYLNVAEWGDGIFGAEAAAQERFGVSAKDLTPRQAAARIETGGVLHGHDLHPAAAEGTRSPAVHPRSRPVHRPVVLQQHDAVTGAIAPGEQGAAQRCIGTVPQRVALERRGPCPGEADGGWFGGARHAAILGHRCGCGRGSWRAVASDVGCTVGAIRRSASPSSAGSPPRPVRATTARGGAPGRPAPVRL